MWYRKNMHQYTFITIIYKEQLHINHLKLIDKSFKIVP